MTDKNNEIEEFEDYEDLDDFEEGPISLIDEDGNTIECELLGFVDYQDEKYAVVTPVDDEEGIAAVLKVGNDPEDDEYAMLETVDDEELANTIFEKFKEEYAADADFEDEE